MAYSALVSLAQTIDLILNYHQDLISRRLKKQIISIDKNAIFLRKFLEDFPDKASNLEGSIRELTHLAEDFVECLLLEQIHVSHKSMFKNQLRGKWKQIQSSYIVLKSTIGSSKSKLIHQPGQKYQRLHYDFHELKKVAKEIESTVEKVREIKDSITVKDERLGDSAPPASSSSRVEPIHKQDMVGFDNDLMAIKCRLCRDSSKREVIPIVGMGGIGKTTLIRNVYDDPLIMQHFDIRVWVTVSQEYSVKEIVARLLVSMKLFDAKNELMEEHHVYQNLKGRKYLIVLDDIWSIKAWDNLNMMFPDDGNGSRIILTTRLSDVASYADSYSPIHEMLLMDEDQSWNLLRRKVFKQDPCPVELEYVGKVIAKSCGGLPLAIVVISGLLVVHQTKAAWENIARNVKSTISGDSEYFDKILSLSYTHLPHYLRPCFLYMGGFPEDYKIRVSKLIKLWVAEGFLKPNRYNKSCEETGEEYLEDLVRRSLVLVTNRKSNGKMKSFSMHDLMREMCIRKAQEENFFSHDCIYLREGMKVPRRVSLFHSDLYLNERVYGRTIRTIICLGYKREGRQSFLGCFRLLRILDLSNASNYHSYGFSYPYFPAEVWELFHLRYLAVYCHFPIPASISNLQNLQTVIIGARKDHRHFFELPVDIWRMSQLRHLVCYFKLPVSFEEGTLFALEICKQFR